MATLEGQKICDSYKDLLQVSNSGTGLDATLRPVESGGGTNSCCELSTTNLKITGTIELDGTAIGFPLGPGPQGDQGTQGPQGFQGTQGPQGTQGYQGTQGPQGDQGTQGPKGDQGFQGLTGPSGGAQGDQGSQGPQGSTGVQGSTGAQGLAGAGNVPTHYKHTWTSGGTTSFSIGLASPALILAWSPTYGPVEIYPTPSSQSTLVAGGHTNYYIWDIAQSNTWPSARFVGSSIHLYKLVYDRRRERESIFSLSLINL